jgi:hypothetical protein
MVLIADEMRSVNVLYWTGVTGDREEALKTKQ